MTMSTDGECALRVIVHPGAEGRAATLSAATRIEPSVGVHPDDGRDVELHVTPDQLELRWSGARRGVSLDVADLRRRLAQGRRTLLARAVACRPGLQVLDGMAGFGLDGLTLAALGCEVELVESHPVMAALLTDAIGRAERLIGGRARARVAAVQHVLGEASRDVVYLDPMFPESGKRALPKQRMQLLRAIAHAPPDDEVLAAWVALARAHARERVVVKRRRRDGVLPGAAPDWRISGRSVRFDVYRGRASDPVTRTGQR
jgi:16S rRNA (guanine1516-N2)-methyltransferase